MKRIFVAIGNKIHYLLKTLITITSLLVFIVQALVCCTSNTNKVPDIITFSEHVAPIIFATCTPCHQANESAPFALTNYQEVRRKGKTIVNVIESGYMPPWPADTSFSHFVGEKKLTLLQKEIIKKWVNSNMLPGDSTSKFNKQIAIKEVPDTVIRFTKPIPIQGNNRDFFVAMKLPITLKNNRFIRKINIQPGNKKLLHHANVHLVKFEDSKKKNIEEGQHWLNHEQLYDESVSLHQQLGLLNDDGTYPELQPSVCNYLPGMQSVDYPSGIGGFMIPKKSCLYINDMHYGPSSKDTIDATTFEFFFENMPPERPIKELQLGTLGVAAVTPPLVILANTIDTFFINYTLQKPITLLTLVPHLHLIGVSMNATAVLPDGKKINLIKIPKWNFRWQYNYTFRTAVCLPKGTRIAVSAVFDNTNNNLLNPNKPPKNVIERLNSMRTTDEMFQFLMLYIDYQKGDESLRLDV